MYGSIIGRASIGVLMATVLTVLPLPAAPRKGDAVDAFLSRMEKLRSTPGDALEKIEKKIGTCKSESERKRLQRAFDEYEDLYIESIVAAAAARSDTSGIMEEFNRGATFLKSLDSSSDRKIYTLYGKLSSFCVEEVLQNSRRADCREALFMLQRAAEMYPGADNTSALRSEIERRENELTEIRRQSRALDDAMAAATGSAANLAAAAATVKAVLAENTRAENRRDAEEFIVEAQSDPNGCPRDFAFMRLKFAETSRPGVRNFRLEVLMVESDYELLQDYSFLEKEHLYLIAEEKREALLKKLNSRGTWYTFDLGDGHAVTINDLLRRNYLVFVYARWEKDVVTAIHETYYEYVTKTEDAAWLFAAVRHAVGGASIKFY